MMGSQLKMDAFLGLKNRKLDDVGMEREVLKEIPGNSKKRQRSSSKDSDLEQLGTSSVPSGAAPVSATALELLDATVDMIQPAVDKLINGHVPPAKGHRDYQPHAVGWGPALRTKANCLLTCKKKSHPAGYVQIHLERERRARSLFGKVERFKSQSGHRLLLALSQVMSYARKC